MKRYIILLTILLAACAQAAQPLPTATPSPEPTTTPEPTATNAPTSTEPSGPVTYSLTEAEARFEIDEVLLGNEKAVVGTNTAITGGDFTVDYADTSTLTFSAVEIAATEFATDSGKRNNAIRKFILETDDVDNQTIVFTPIAVEGLPGEVEPGESYDVTLTGELAMHGLTQPVTFEGALTPTAESVTGSFSSTITYADWDISLPGFILEAENISFVADNLTLFFDFTAAAQP